MSEINYKLRSVREDTVIVCESCEGYGIEDNPYRIVTSYYRKDGSLICRLDGWATEEGKVPAQEKVTCPQILAAENEGMP